MQCVFFSDSVLDLGNLDELLQRTYYYMTESIVEKLSLNVVDGLNNIALPWNFSKITPWIMKAKHVHPEAAEILV